MRKEALEWDTKEMGGGQWAGSRHRRRQEGFVGNIK
jgi:hypothetical protein